MRWVLVLAVALALAGCAEENADTQQPTFSSGGSTSPTASTATPSSATTTQPPAGHTVIAQGNRFAPEQIFVPVGAVVTWWNNDAVPHTVSFDDLTFDQELAEIRDARNTAQRAFDANGTFAYHCKFHSGMRGWVVVGTGVLEATGPTSSPTPPTTPPSPPPEEPGPEPAPTPTPVAPPTPTPTPSPTPPPSPTPTPAPPPTPTPTTPSPVTINIQGFSFVGTHTFHVGTVVTWKNLDSAAHTATANDGSFNTGTLTTGGTASHTFSSAGSFPYKCAIHPSMTATITVTA